MDELDAGRVEIDVIARVRHERTVQQPSQRPRQKKVDQKHDDRRDHVIAMQRPCYAHVRSIPLYGAQCVDRAVRNRLTGYRRARTRRHTGRNFLALSKRFCWCGWFASGGLTWTSVDNQVLSGHAQFMTAVGYDFGRLTLSLRHLSNGSTSGRNHGETFALLEVAF